MGKKLFFVLLGSFSLLIPAACTSVSINFPAITFGKEVTKNVLTGLPGENGRLLAVKIDDTNQAHPQIGIESADVVYIEKVEAGVTRLLAIYSSGLPATIGPVRSARISDIDLLAQYGHVGFAFSGAQRKMYPLIDGADLENLGAQRNSPTIYFRDPTRLAPVNLMLRPDLLLAKSSNVATAKSVGWIFGAKQAGGRGLVSAQVDWPNARYDVIWSVNEARWVLEHNKKPNLAASGVVLGSPTFIIQMVSITDSTYGDKFGGITPLITTVGSGKAYLLRSGEVFDLTWTRPSSQSATTWRLTNGEEARFAPGQIWIALTDRVPTFVYAEAST